MNFKLFKNLVFRRIARDGLRSVVLATLESQKNVPRSACTSRREWVDGFCTVRYAGSRGIDYYQSIRAVVPLFNRVALVYLTRRATRAAFKALGDRSISYMELKALHKLCSRNANYDCIILGGAGAASETARQRVLEAAYFYDSVKCVIMLG